MTALHIKSRAQKAAYFGVLSALALALNWAEQLIAPLLSLPLGAKPGLSNIAVMMASAMFGLPGGLAVAMIKAAFAGIIRGPVAMLLSGAGGLVSAVLIGVLLKSKKQILSETGIGILGGAAHNLVQLACAALLMQNSGVLWLSPMLIALGVIAGAVTGTLVKLIRKAKFFS